MLPPTPTVPKPLTETGAPPGRVNSPSAGPLTRPPPGRMPSPIIGERGRRPVVVAYATHQEHRLIAEEIPGVRVTGRGEIRASWDMVPHVAQALGVPAPAPPQGVAELPGLERLRLLPLFQAARPYQRRAAAFLCEHGVGVAAVPCRGGKCLILLFATEALGAGRTLIVSPKSAIYGWAEEVHKWTDGQVALLRGRGARDLHWGCRPCGTTGRVDRPGGGFERCSTCRGRGFQAIRVKQTTKALGQPEKPARDTRRNPEKRAANPRPRVNLLTGPGSPSRPRGPRPPTKDEAAVAHELQLATWEPRYACPDHPDATSDRPDAYCSVCRDQMRRALRSASHVLVTKERLLTHRQSVAGQLQKRTDLIGWRYELMAIKWDVLAVDETHQLAGRPTSKGAIGPDSAKGIIKGLCTQAARVFGLTATPIGDAVKAVWSELDILTGGLFGSMYDFDRRYLGGEFVESDDPEGPHRGSWELTGDTPFIESELRPRIAHWMYSVPDEEVHKDLPPITRIVHRVDPPRRLPPPKVLRRQGLKKALGDEAEFKMEEMFEMYVLPALEAQQKVLIYVNVVSNVNRVYRELWKRVRSSEWRERIAAGRLVAWRIADGETRAGRDVVSGERARYEVARAFREHTGPGVWIATSDSMGEGGVDLAGGRLIVNLDINPKPQIKHQAEERPNAVTRTHGITIVDMVVRGALSDEAVMKLANKLKQIDTVLPTADNKERIAALTAFEEDFAKELLESAQQMRDEDEAGGIDLTELDVDGLAELIALDC